RSTAARRHPTTRPASSSPARVAACTSMARTSSTPRASDSPTRRLASASSAIRRSEARCPATVPLGALPAIYASTNSFTGNLRDTLLLQGGLLSGQSVTVPRVNGVPWRVITPLSVGGGGTLTFARGDTVTFDSTAAIIVGDTLTGSGSLHAIAPDTAPILLETTPGLPYWHGITYLNAVGDTSLRNVTVAGAGYFLPCPLIDCLGTTIGAIRVVGTLASNLVFDSITVRNVGFYALQALQSG